MTPKKVEINILFVCLGNICRSPMAKAVFDYTQATKGNFVHCHTRSVGTSGFHEGDPADVRTIQICAIHAVPLHHTARKITAEDAAWAEYIIGMDHANIDVLHQLLSVSFHPKIHLFGEFTDGSQPSEVADPYWSDLDAFEQVYQQLSRFSCNLLEYLHARHV